MLKKLQYFLLFFLLLSISSAWYFTTTPYYALMRTFYAMKNNNLDDFQYYCDVDSLSESLIDEIINIKPENLPTNLAMTLKMAQSDTSKIFFFKKLLAKGIKTQILKGIKENKIIKNDKEKIQMSHWLSMRDIFISENHTVIKLDIPKDGEIIPIHFRLRRLEGRWKLVGMEQLQVLLLKAFKM